MPLLSTAPSSEDLDSQAEAKPIFLDRDTLGHWARKKIESNELLKYQAEWNSSSLDGCPGLRAAMRDHGESVWLVLVKARMRRVMAQKETLLVGVVLGMVLLMGVQTLQRLVVHS